MINKCLTLVTPNIKNHKSSNWILLFDSSSSGTLTILTPDITDHPTGFAVDMFVV